MAANILGWNNEENITAADGGFLRHILIKVYCVIAILQYNKYIAKMDTVSGKLPPRRFSPIKFPPIKVLTKKISTWNILTHAFKYSHHRFFSFFVFSLLCCYYWYYLKDCFVILCFKSTEVRLIAVYQKNS